MPFPPCFAEITIDQLEAGPTSHLDELGFGVIGMTPAGLVDVYNATEVRLSGLSPERVVGWHFFDSIGLCMNNFMVAQRFQDETCLDETINYVLTLRMRPTPVKLRLLKQPSVSRSYILIER